jgi:hypothetical protein
MHGSTTTTTYLHVSGGVGIDGAERLPSREVHPRLGQLGGHLGKLGTVHAAVTICVVILERRLHMLDLVVVDGLQPKLRHHRRRVSGSHPEYSVKRATPHGTSTP